LAGPFLAHLLIRETEKNDYIIVFWCGTILQFVSLILCLILKTDKFKYEKKKRKEKGLKEVDVDVKMQIN
jgi:hypothetical protein